MLNVLFVCSRNQWRSPTAEAVFRNRPGVRARSCGTSRRARRSLGPQLLRWADLVLVMEREHKRRIVETFPEDGRAAEIHVLDVPDDYGYMDPELVALLESRVTPILEDHGGMETGYGSTPSADLHDFADHFLVECPRCGSYAVVRPPTPTARPRLVCGHCGHTAESADNVSILHQGYWVGIDGPASKAVDFYFREPLWLRQPCCGHVLWAINGDHLEWLAGFVSAKHRTGRRDPDTGWSNRSLASRLPRWMTSAKNRQAVLKALDRLRERLPTGG